MVAPRKQSSVVEKIFTDQRKQRALALAGLMAIAARDGYTAEAVAPSAQVKEGLYRLSDELITELAELLELTPPAER